jgi:hypothetical protein
MVLMSDCEIIQQNGTIFCNNTYLPESTY